MDYLDKARRVIALEAAELGRLHDRLDGAAIGRAVKLLLKCLERRGKIVVVGVGKSGHIGQKIAATLTSTGSPAGATCSPTTRARSGSGGSPRRPTRSRTTARSVYC